MKLVEIYTKNWCGYCRMAKMLLDDSGIEYEEYDVTSDREKEQEMVQRSSGHTVPQIFIADEPVGGFMDLAALAQVSDLSELIRSEEVEDQN